VTALAPAAVFDRENGLEGSPSTADSVEEMPSSPPEMHASRVAARERRASLVAGVALTVLALGVLVFALIAWKRAPTEEQGAVRPILASAPQAPTAAIQAGDDAADVPGAGTRAVRSAGAASASDSRAVDRIPMTAQSASLFMPLYRRASETFGVNWRLIASIHQQETSFSSAPGTYHGLNFARCCAGPMQFNVENGPVSTWERFSDAYRRAPRPANYPHRTRKHPSVYDDFDAVMAAGALLRANGAGKSLDGSAWLASYHYYGHDMTGLQYADQVLARAVGWAQRGVCVQCGVDPRLTARFDAAFAAPYRAELVAAERRARAAARAKREARERARRVRAAHRRAARVEAERRARAREAAAKKAKAAAEKASRSRDGDGSSEAAAHTAGAATTTTKQQSPAPAQPTTP